MEIIRVSAHTKFKITIKPVTSEVKVKIGLWGSTSIQGCSGLQSKLNIRSKVETGSLLPSHSYLTPLTPISRFSVAMLSLIQLSTAIAWIFLYLSGGLEMALSAECENSSCFT